MNEATWVLRLHQDIYLPLVLAAKETGVSVETVIEVALRRFATLSVQEKTELMYAFHFGPGYSTAKASGGVRWYFGTEPRGTVIRRTNWYRWLGERMKRLARVTVSWILRR